MQQAGAYVRLETVGRRTGNPHQVIVRFLTYNGKIVVFAQKGPPPDWVLNIQSNPNVKVLGDGREIGGRASFKRARGIDDPVLGAFTRKYGRPTVEARYWGQLDYIEIEPVGAETALSYDELIYGDLEAAFDGVAEDYDRHILGNPVNLWLRNRSVSLMSRVFKPGQTILEIGCGTGTETISLAKRGIRVVATDISGKMLEVLQRHAKENSVGDMIVPVHCRPYQLRERLSENGVARVDGAYSTYGAVNTEPRLTDFFRTVHSLLPEEGNLILGVWNRYCLYEILGYTLKANPSMATARFRNPVPVGKSRFCVSTNAYTVGSLNEMILGMFTLDRVYGVGMLLPPSNLTRYLPPARLIPAFERAETAMEGSFPMNRLGDHFLAVYTRQGER